MLRLLASRRAAGYRASGPDEGPTVRVKGSAHPAQGGGQRPDRVRPPVARVLGWATCVARVREDVAAYLLSVGAKLNIWSAIARMVSDDPARIGPDGRDTVALHLVVSR